MFCARSIICRPLPVGVIIKNPVDSIICISFSGHSVQFIGYRKRFVRFFKGALIINIPGYIPAVVVGISPICELSR